MAYVRPLVQVFQEYESFSGTAQATVLNPCIVGPCYQFVAEDSNKEEDLFKSFFGVMSSTGIPEREVPLLIPGAVLDAASVKLRFTDVYMGMSAAEVDVEAVTDNEVSFTALNYPTGISVGDYLTVTDGADTVADKLLLVGVDPANHTVSLNRVISGTPTAPKAMWLRKVDEFTLTETDAAVTIGDSTPTVTVGTVTRTVDSVDKTVFSASVNCGYRAIRRDIDVLESAASVDEIEAKLGEPIPENPLAYGAMIALANTINSVYFIGVDDDNLEGYTRAKDILENAEDIYSIVPLTQDAGALSMFKTHVEASSKPEEGKWRIAFGNSPLPNTVTMAKGLTRIRPNTDATLKVVFCSEGTFLSSGVNAGDEFVLTNDSGTEIKALVSTVLSEDMLILDTALTDVTQDTVEYEFKITRVADRVAQAAAIAKTSEAYGSHRFYHVWPDVCVIDGQDEPGYYLCCALAGMVSGLPSHQGFTRISIAGISGVKHSSDYFNASQLDKIADGGTTILMQLSVSSPPYVRHQLSTDTTTYEFRELSFVKNFDYVSYICKDALDGFIGRYNVTPSTLGALETVVTAALESLKLYSVAKIGSPILDYSIRSVAQLATQRDRVEINVAVEFPYALNMIGLHLVSPQL